jgi:hypothetical protein
LECASLKRIDLPATLRAFRAADFSGSTLNLECITVAEGNPVFYVQGNCLIERESGTLLLVCRDGEIPEGVKIIGERAFSGASWLVELAIPEGVVTIERAAFSGCKNLKSVTFADSVESIGEYAFYGCTALWYLEFGEESRLSSIGDSAFYDCADLGAYNGFVLVLPSQLKTIGASAFTYCWNFLYVVIPESVESIGYDAFGTAFRLTIYCEAKERPEGWNAYWAHADHTVVWGYVAPES